MIDKKIEEAAKEYAWNNNDSDEENYLNLKKAFRYGSRWLLNSLWHDAHEEPVENEPILAEYMLYDTKKACKIDLHKPSYFPWQEKIINEKISRWLYIDDLLATNR